MLRASCSIKCVYSLTLKVLWPLFLFCFARRFISSIHSLVIKTLHLKVVFYDSVFPRLFCVHGFTVAIFLFDERVGYRFYEYLNIS